MFGDNGTVTIDRATRHFVRAASTDLEVAGNDVITTGLGDDLVVAGAGDDRIDPGADNNVVAGDNASLTFDADGFLLFFETIGAAIGGNDLVRIKTGGGNDLVFGGAGDDVLNPGRGVNVVFGDDRFARFGHGVLIRAGSTDPAVHGNDAITTGWGRDTVVGGSGDDTIDADIGNDIVFGGAQADAIALGKGKNVVVQGEGAALFAAGVVVKKV